MTTTARFVLKKRRSYPYIKKEFAQVLCGFDGSILHLRIDEIICRDATSSAQVVNLERSIINTPYHRQVSNITKAFELVRATFARLTATFSILSSDWYDPLERIVSSNISRTVGSTLGGDRIRRAPPIVGTDIIPCISFQKRRSNIERLNRVYARLVDHSHRQPALTLLTALLNVSKDRIRRVMNKGFRNAPAPFILRLINNLEKAVPRNHCFLLYCGSVYRNTALVIM